MEVVSPHGRAWIWTRKQAGVHVRGRVRVGGARVERGRRRRLRRRVRRLPRAAHGLALVGGHRRARRRARGGLEPRRRRARRAARERAHRLGGRRAARGRARSRSRTTSRGRRPALHALVRARGPHAPAALPQRLPPAVRHLRGRATRAGWSSSRATASWSGTTSRGDAAASAGPPRAARGSRASCRHVTRTGGHPAPERDGHGPVALERGARGVARLRPSSSTTTRSARQRQSTSIQPRPPARRVDLRARQTGARATKLEEALLELAAGDARPDASVRDDRLGPCAAPRRPRVARDESRQGERVGEPEHLGLLDRALELVRAGARAARSNSVRADGRDRDAVDGQSARRGARQPRGGPDARAGARAAAEPSRRSVLAELGRIPHSAPAARWLEHRARPAGEHGRHVPRRSTRSSVWPTA